MISNVQLQLKKGAGTETGKIILSKIKNTMSDRAATEKAFNDLLSHYRSEILPTVIEEWEQLSNEERQSMSRMYNFYCGMHFVTNMAEHASEAVKMPILTTPILNAEQYV